MQIPRNGNHSLFMVHKLFAMTERRLVLPEGHLNWLTTAKPVKLDMKTTFILSFQVMVELQI